MSLREDITEIARKEGYENPEAFLSVYLVENGRTFKELKNYLEASYGRYYSWVYVYQFCSQWTPGYKVSSRPQRPFDWDKNAVKAGYKDLNHIFEQWDGPIVELARALDVYYPTLWWRHKKWKKRGGKNEKQNVPSV